jgi:EpsI family protein
MVTRHVIAILVIGLSGFYAAELRSARRVAGDVPALEQLPRELNGWEGQDLPANPEVEAVLGADASLNRQFRRSDGAEVGFYLAYFATQKVNSQIHSPRNCLPGAGWQVESIGRRTLRLGGVDRPVAWMQISSKRRVHEVAYWFCTRSGRLSGEYALKWDLVKCSLAGQPTNAAMVRYDAAISDSSAMREVMSLMEPEVERVLGGVGLR